MPGFNRPKQRVITGVFPQRDNRAYITPSRGIAGLLRNPTFDIDGNGFWILSGGAAITLGFLKVPGTSEAQQAINRVRDGDTLAIQLDVTFIGGTITVEYAGLPAGVITTPGTHTFTVTAALTNLLRVIAAGAGDSADFESIYARRTA